MGKGNGTNSDLGDYLRNEIGKGHSGVHLIGTPDTAALVRDTVQTCKNLLDMKHGAGSGDERISYQILEDYDAFADDTMIPTLTERVRKQHVYLVSDPHGDVNAKRNLTSKIMEIKEENREKRTELIEELVKAAKSTNDKMIHDLLVLQTVTGRGGAETGNLVQLAMPYSRQDKITRSKRQPFSFDLIGKWIGKLLGNKGYAITADLHNEASESNLSNEQTTVVNLDTGWFIEECLKVMQKDRDNVTLSGADQGGDTKIKGIAKDSELHNITVVKSRDYSKRNAIKEDGTTIVGDIEGKDVLIHDDILDTGGTLCSLLEKMLVQNPRSINIAITHGMFHGKAFERLQKIIDSSNGVIEKVFTTNSIYKENLPDYVEVIDSSTILANTILSIHTGRGIDRDNNEDYLKPKN